MCRIAHRSVVLTQYVVLNNMVVWNRAYLGYSPYKHLAHDSEGNRTIGSDDL